jgi:hypothetical protein
MTRPTPADAIAVGDLVAVEGAEFRVVDAVEVRLGA